MHQTNVGLILYAIKSILLLIPAPYLIKELSLLYLDEVDYMTKNAQHALKYLLQGFNKNVSVFALFVII